jgi:hypothetical protein
MHFISLVYTTSLLGNVIFYKATLISIMYFLYYDFGLISEKLGTLMLNSGYFLERKSGLSTLRREQSQTQFDLSFIYTSLTF